MQNSSQPNLQPNLQNDTVRLVPLRAEDFDVLYSIASDPLIWEQHPSKTRYQLPVFTNFFSGAMESKGAFILYDVASGEPAGCSRFYDWDDQSKTILIGYTFFARKFWGTGLNKSAKKLMINYAFGFADKVQFHIGAINIRSQKAIEKLGAKKIAEQAVAYYGEKENLNFIYEISKVDWEIQKENLS